jgi:hypothetical protein
MRPDTLYQRLSVWPQSVSSRWTTQDARLQKKGELSGSFHSGNSHRDSAEPPGNHNFPNSDLCKTFMRTLVEKSIEILPHCHND